MFQTLKNAWKVPELKSKLLFTLVIVVLYRIGSVLPVPFTDPSLLTSANEFAGSIFQYLNILSGDAFGRASLFALGVSPYITSSIVIQLLTIAIPALERKAKEGEEGKKWLSALTRWVTVGLALITAIGYAFFLKNQNWLVLDGSTGSTVFRMIVVIACHCAGASLVMWLAEKVNENGIGNGISMILFAGIVARMPTDVTNYWNMLFNAEGKFSILGLVLVIVSLAFTLAIVGFVVFMTNSERRIPVQYAKKVVGRKMYGGQGTNLPIKLNMTGVMPIIFANSIVAIPATIAAFFPNSKFWTSINNFFNYNSVVYVVLFLILIIAFSYFYIAISFNPVEVANNLKKSGGSIPGIRPGRPTTDYITRVLNRITLIGAFCLGVVAVLPMIVNMIASLFGSTMFTSLAFSGSSLLIVVGVALETVRDLEAQMSLRHYKGFLE